MHSVVSFLHVGLQCRGIARACRPARMQQRTSRVLERIWAGEMWRDERFYRFM